MLNAVLREKIEVVPYRLLYDAKVPLNDDPHLFQAVKGCIRKVGNRGVDIVVERDKKRRAVKYPSSFNSIFVKTDELAVRFRQFPNVGDYGKYRLRELEKPIYDEKAPKDFPGLWRSVEFECIFNSEESLKEFIALCRQKKLLHNVIVKKDDSLRKDDQDQDGVPKEICVMFKKGEEHIIESICDSFKGRAYINNSCGAHVHFDMRAALSEDEVRRYGKRVARWVPVLKMLLPVSRRDNEHCRTVINDFDTDTGRRQDRYAFVNLKAYRKFKTLEIRGHSATLRADKVLNWIKLIEVIMTSDRRMKNPNLSSVEDLISFYKLDDGLAGYVRERSQKFNACSPSLVIPPAHNIPAAP